jgi:hypothetical protein
MEAIRFTTSVIYNSGLGYKCSHPGDMDGEYYPKSEADAEISNLKAEISALTNTITVAREDFNAMGEELARLEPVLKRIAEWGCNGQCVELCGTKCPCCIAQEAIAAAKEE